MHGFDFGDLGGKTPGHAFADPKPRERLFPSRDGPGDFLLDTAENPADLFVDGFG